MPELPEVRTVAKLLNKEIANKTIKEIWIGKPKMIKEVTPNEFKKSLIGRRIIAVENSAKFLVFRFDKNTVMLSHLRMEGKYHTKPWDNETHDHVVFTFTDGSKLFYNDTRQFGTFHIRDYDFEKVDPIAKMGAEPKDINIDELYKKLQRKRIAIKTALLDQTLIAGLGNIYVNEVLYDVKIDPTRSTNSITKKQVEEIVKSSKRIMDESIKLGGTSIHSYEALDKVEGGYQHKLLVHGKEGQKCPNSNETIKKIKVNGRGTYYCPNEQK